MLRLRSDEQLVTLFRAGDEEAFRAIHDRYRQRLLAYTRQMLCSRQDAEDALQDVFVRAYASLRSNGRELALRAWLYRIAHNRCIDELRRPAAPTGEALEMLARSPIHDPIAQAEQRESLRRLIVDVRRLPEQQRSALLMRELAGMSYAELSGALDVSVPAVKSLLVRARVSLVQSARARDTACAEIREELILAHDRGRRPAAMARRHLRDCAGCREFRTEVRGVSRQIAALVPAVGPAGVLANLLGFGGGGAAAGGGSCATAGVLAGGAGHVATLLAAAAVTAGGAVEIQHTLASSVPHRSQVGAARPVGTPATPPGPTPAAAPAAVKTVDPPVSSGGGAAPRTSFPALPVARRQLTPAVATPPAPAPAPTSTSDPGSTPISSASLDPSMGPGPFMGGDGSGGGTGSGTGDTASGGTSTATGSGSGSGSGSGLLSSTAGSGSDPSAGQTPVTAITAGDGSTGVSSGSGTSASGGTSTTSSRSSTSTSRS